MAASGLFALCLMATTAHAATSFCDADGWTPVWRDDFDGKALDEGSWTVLQTSGDSRVRDSCGMAKNVEVRNGSLVLTSRREKVEGCAYGFTTGAVQSQGKQNWRGATRACVKAILPGVTGRAQGVWPAHWMVVDHGACWPTNGEIDIMEMINGDARAHTTYHWGATCGDDRSKTANVRLPTWNTEFHEYAVEYNTTHVTFAVDNKVTLTVTADAAPMYDVSYYMILNTALGGPWPGPVSDGTVFPVEHTIDYVAVSQQK